MFKLLIFTIFLTLSPSLSLIEDLYEAEKDCYSGCNSNYLDNLSNLDACKIGCNLKLHNENCADQCKLLSLDEQIQASCIVGCSMNHLVKTPEHHVKQSIVLVHIHENRNPIEILRKVVKHLKEKAKLQFLLKKDETKKIHHEDKLDHLHEYIENLRTKLQNVVHKEPKLPIYILSSIIIITSIILLFLIISICRKTPRHQDLSIRAQELILENEKLHPDTPLKIKLMNI